MKIQYTYFMDKDKIGEEHYFLVLPNFQFSKRADTELAVMQEKIDQMERLLDSRDEEEKKELEAKIVTAKTEFNKIVNNPQYTLEKTIFDFLMYEVGDAFALFNNIPDMIEWLDKDWTIEQTVWIKRKTESGKVQVFPKTIEKNMRFPLSRIYVMSEETGKRIGDFYYKVHEDMV